MHDQVSPGHAIELGAGGIMMLWGEDDHVEAGDTKKGSSLHNNRPWVRGIMVERVMWREEPV